MRAASLQKCAEQKQENTTILSRGANLRWDTLSEKRRGNIEQYDNGPSSKSECVYGVNCHRGGGSPSVDKAWMTQYDQGSKRFPLREQPL